VDACPPNQVLVHPVDGENGKELLCDPKMASGVESLTEDISRGPPNAAAKIPSRMDTQNPQMKMHWFWFCILSSRSSCVSISTCGVDKLQKSRMNECDNLTYEGVYIGARLFRDYTCHRCLWFVCSNFWSGI
jgi:hypothetical protein